MWISHHTAAKKVAFHACTLVSLSIMASTCWKMRIAQISRFSIASGSLVRHRRHCTTTTKSSLVACCCALKQRKHEEFSFKSLLAWYQHSLTQLTVSDFNRYNLQDISSGGKRRKT